MMHAGNYIACARDDMASVTRYAVYVLMYMMHVRIHMISVGGNMIYVLNGMACVCRYIE
jgi:hypothetical protein